MADLGPSGRSLFDSTSNELEISSNESRMKKKVLVVLRLSNCFSHSKQALELTITVMLHHYIDSLIKFMGIIEW